MSFNDHICESCGTQGGIMKIARCECCNKNICYNCVTNCIDDSLDPNSIKPYLNNSAKWEVDHKHCPFCNGLDVSKEDLLEYVLEKLKISYNDLKKEYLKRR